MVLADKRNGPLVTRLVLGGIVDGADLRVPLLDSDAPEALVRSVITTVKGRAVVEFGVVGSRDLVILSWECHVCTRGTDGAAAMAYESRALNA